MRIYIIERITLSELTAGPDAPTAGDRVVMFRDAQDLEGEERARLAGSGVRVDWGPDLIDKSTLREIDAFLARYLKKWFMESGEDVSRDGDMSLGMYLAGQLSSVQKPTMTVVLGEICRRVLEADGTGETTVYCDLVDGQTAFANQLPHPDISPRRRLVKALAQARGCAFQDLRVVHPLPNIHKSPVGNEIARMLRSYIGGLRPDFVIGRLRARFALRDRPGVYVYFNHGIALIASRLASQTGLYVYGDRPRFPGVIPLRYDHMLALPPRTLLAAARRLYSQFRHLTKDRNDARFRLNGFDYGPFLLAGLGCYLYRRLSLDLIKIAQGRKLLRRFRIDITVINGDTASMYGAIGYAQRHRSKVVHVDHGLNMYHQGLRNGFLNQPHVTYIIHGRDHLAGYGSDLPADGKPRRPLLANPATAVMNPTRARRSPTWRNRVLMANYTPHYANNSARFFRYDRYMRDLLTAARDLIERGMTVTYHPHHGETFAYISHMIETMGLAGRVRIDDVPDFAEALAEHDVFVANTTSCIYQSLFAGWPTIFYDPEPESEHLLGMPVADDIFRPMASSPAELVDLILSCADPDSPAARFPGAFATTLAPRFIGRDADRGDEVIADFIVDELSAEEKRRAA